MDIVVTVAAIVTYGAITLLGVYLDARINGRSELGPLLILWPLLLPFMVAMWLFEWADDLGARHGRLS